MTKENVLARLHLGLLPTAEERKLLDGMTESEIAKAWLDGMQKSAELIQAKERQEFEEAVANLGPVMRAAFESFYTKKGEMGEMIESALDVVLRMYPKLIPIMLRRPIAGKAASHSPLLQFGGRTIWEAQFKDLTRTNKLFSSDALFPDWLQGVQSGDCVVPAEDTLLQIDEMGGAAGIRVKPDNPGLDGIHCVEIVCVTGPHNFDPAFRKFELEEGGRQHLLRLAYRRSAPSMLMLVEDVLRYDEILKLRPKFSKHSAGWRGDGRVFTPFHRDDKDRSIRIPETAWNAEKP